MSVALMAGKWAEIWGDIQSAFTGVSILYVILETIFFFAILFLVSKVLRDNEATKLMIVYWGIIFTGCIMHIIDGEMIDQHFLLIYVLLVSAIMLIMFNVEVKKYFWDVHKIGGVTEKSQGGTEVRSQAETERCIKEVVTAIQNMSKNKVGALIVLSKGGLPKDILQSGAEVNSEISSRMIEGIFYPGSPLHDGAMILRGHKIQAASCYLPLTQRTSYPKEFGTRHRAAIGITEAADVVTLVVSEETGVVSIVKQGSVTRYADHEMLTTALRDYYWLELPLSERKRMGGNK